MRRPEPPADCGACPRLAGFRHDNRARHPAFFNAPVPSFGQADARLLIVGLAPGLKGANQTGRPFTGDYAGDLLYATLQRFALSEGRYAGRADDGLALRDCRITNAVRCVPPQNKPVGAEVRTCRAFLLPELTQAPAPRAVLALGKVAHDSVLAALGHRLAAYPFRHGVRHRLPGGPGQSGLDFFDSYHCSRYNTNTGRLTEAMFHAVFADIVAALDEAARG